jgi:hypothetical protein
VIADPFNGSQWPLAEAVIDYIARNEAIPLARACVELQTKMREGLVAARGPINGANASKIDSEFWRFALPGIDGAAVNLSSLIRLRWFEIRATDVLSIWPVSAVKKLHPGGAPPRYDWDSIEIALEEECRLQESVPHRAHSDNEWRTQADAIKYLCEERFNKQWIDGGPALSTMKEKVGPMLKRIRAKMAGNPRLIAFSLRVPFGNATAFHK